PFDITELALRINQILHRTLSADGSEVIRSGPMVIDMISCDVTIYGKRVELTFREYELLRFLAGNKGRVFSREELLNRVWGYDYFGGDRTVDTHIRRLRSKTDDPNNSFIETVRNIGYRFKRDK
ncbi:MAG: response regulator transcription factor, partial [Dehalococcoidales bacterium]